MEDNRFLWEVRGESGYEMRLGAHMNRRQVWTYTRVVGF